MEQKKLIGSYWIHHDAAKQEEERMLIMKKQ
jgi:hypothetical protein